MRFNHRTHAQTHPVKTVGAPTHEKDVFEQVDVSGSTLDAVEQSFIPNILDYFWVVRGLLQDTKCKFIAHDEESAVLYEFVE